MSELFTADYVAEVLGVHVDALRDIPDFPPLIERGGITGYCADAFLRWGEAIHRKSISDGSTREIVSLFEAADLLGASVREMAQMHMKGAPRFDPFLPRALSIHGELIGFLKDEILRYRAQRDAMAEQAGGVH
jgi:hypothetical protein